MVSNNKLEKLLEWNKFNGLFYFNIIDEFIIVFYKIIIGILLNSYNDNILLVLMGVDDNDNEKHDKKFVWIVVWIKL